MSRASTSARGGGAVARPRTPHRPVPKATPESVRATLKRLRAIHPDAHCELEHRNAFELIVATVLSAQATDVSVNKATPRLFAKYPNAAALAKADPQRDVEPLISTIGMYRQKAKNVVGLAKKLVELHGGEVPRRLEQLVELPGVGRKTANVVLGVAFHAPEGVVVDTHVQRVSQRLGWTKNTEPPKIEQDLCALIPREDWDITSHVLIFHGRRVCFARKPSCEACGVNDVCPSAFAAENVGRKPTRAGREAKPAVGGGAVAHRREANGAVRAARRRGDEASGAAGARDGGKRATSGAVTKRAATKRAAAKRDVDERGTNERVPNEAAARNRAATKRRVSPRR